MATPNDQSTHEASAAAPVGHTGAAAPVVLVTGAAGFIGSHVAHRLLDRGERVVGLDDLNDYYDPTLKEARLAKLLPRPGFTFVKLDVADRASLSVGS